MKTPMQILQDKGLDDLPTDDVIDIMFAMKEYAKESIERACIETRQHFNGHSDEWRVFFERLKEAIDAQ